MWQFRMQLHLQALGVYGIVDGREPAPPDPTAIPEPKPGDKELEGSSSTPAERAIRIDRQAVREWREYQSRKDMAAATIILGLADEIARRYRGDEYLRNPAAVWKQIRKTRRSSTSTTSAPSCTMLSWKNVARSTHMPIGSRSYAVKSRWQVRRYRTVNDSSI